MKLILIRHGESTANKDNIFTGWLDVDLTPLGEKEAEKAGQKIAKLNIPIDYAYTSLLKRAIKTTQIILEVIDDSFLPVKKTWRLNERHYGALQGLNKAEVAKEYGEEQVKIWRRSYGTRPPLLKSFPIEKKYQNLDIRTLPKGESLYDTLQRVLPFWEDQLAKGLKEEKNILVVAHGNSLRGLIKYIEKISDEDIVNLNIATGEIRVYEFDASLNLVTREVY